MNCPKCGTKMEKVATADPSGNKIPAWRWPCKTCPWHRVLKGS